MAQGQLLVSQRESELTYHPVKFRDTQGIFANLSSQENYLLLVDFRFLPVFYVKVYLVRASF